MLAESIRLIEASESVEGRCQGGQVARGESLRILKSEGHLGASKLGLEVLLTAVHFISP